jgi:hypothetical protein
MAAELTTALPPFVLPHFVVHKIDKIHCIRVSSVEESLRFDG